MNPHDKNFFNKLYLAFTLLLLLMLGGTLGFMIIESYSFIDALNQFDWVVEVDDTLQFKGVKDGINTHFTLKIHTKVQ